MPGIASKWFLHQPVWAVVSVSGYVTLQVDEAGLALAVGEPALKLTVETPDIILEVESE